MRKRAAISAVNSAVNIALLCCTGELSFAGESIRLQSDVSDHGTPPAKKNISASDGLALDEVIVTAAPVSASKMQQSLSVSTLDAQQVNETIFANAAEILRVIPGLRAESSGGEGNANLTVRGLPISAGGARYVQLQEDGLPILQFGDIAFATADEFLRVDSGLDRLEVVRGGSASTMATNSPGGVINFIAQTGMREGGAIGVVQGLDFSQTRYEFHYGQPIGDGSTRYFVAGFYRKGDGVRDVGVTTEQGGQIKANATHEFADGYIRLSVKHLDDQVPMQLPVPVTTTSGHIARIHGVDPRTASFYSPYWVKDRTIDSDNQAKFSRVNDGLQVQSDAVGVETNFNLANGFSIEDKFRISDNRGRFIAVYPADNAYTSGPFTYATGPYAGQSYNGNVFTATVFNVSLDDLGNMLNDFKLRKTIGLSGDSDFDVLAGWYTSIQQVGLSWYFNQYLMTAGGSKPALVSNAASQIYSAPVFSSTSALIAQGTDVFGGCCVRHIDSEYTTQSPYLNLALHTGSWNIDAGVRRDRQKAKGDYNQAVNQQFASAAEQTIDYDVAETSYSLGANYQIHRDLAVFARTSKGYVFNADRIMFDGFALDDSVSIPVNAVKQIEVGAKWRLNNFSTFVTGFIANTQETNFEATTQAFTKREYDAHGIELEAAYIFGNFRVNGGVTYTDAEISKAEDVALESNIPRRQADWTYQLTPSYMLEKINFGATLIGSSRAWGDDANSIRMPGYAILNAFINISFDSGITLSLTANNLTNKLAYTEVQSDGHAARAFNGRSTMAALHYAF